MVGLVSSFGLNGLEGYLVEVEVDIKSGLPKYDIVGLPDTAIKESKERVESAIKNSMLAFPSKRITINLAPASTKKEGPIFDLAIAISILVASEQIKSQKYKDFVVIGELSLDGKIRAINGLLPLLISAKNSGHTNFIIPSGNEGEASFIDGINVFSFSNLLDVFNFLNGNITKEPRGTGGFGYDPVFESVESSKTFGEMTDKEKNEISHRRRAFEKLKNIIAKI